MPSDIVIEFMEIIGFSFLAVLTVGGVVLSGVGALTCLLTWEHAATPATTKVVPHAEPVARAGGMPTPLAG